VRAGQQAFQNESVHPDATLADSTCFMTCDKASSAATGYS